MFLLAYQGASFPGFQYWILSWTHDYCRELRSFTLAFQLSNDSMCVCVYFFGPVKGKMLGASG
jgi:hypothetical protein